MDDCQELVKKGHSKKIAQKSLLLSRRSDDTQKTWVLEWHKNGYKIINMMQISSKKWKYLEEMKNKSQN